MRLLTLGLLCVISAFGDLIGDVRSATASGDFGAAEKLVQQSQNSMGQTPENVLAYSWLARGALAAKRFDAAEKYASETKRQVAAELLKRKLDAEPNVPLALGAAIEVLAQSSAARGERDQAVMYLRGELKRYRGSSIVARLQKNVNLLSLEGKHLPRIDKVPPSVMAGKPVLVFLWAHWCSDCKSMASDLARLKGENPGLLIIAPTQTYGYAESGREVGAEEETNYISKIWRDYYQNLPGILTPVSKATFDSFGASTTPTLALADGTGVVKLYHPGKMTYSELSPLVRSLVKR